MHKKLRLLLVVISALVAGCGTTARIQTEYHLTQGDKFRLQLTTPPDISEQGLQILRDRLRAQLSSSGLLAEPSDAWPRTLEVAVTNYRMRHGAARQLLGVFAGSDNIQSTVRIIDEATGIALSKFVVESKNSTAWGASRVMIEDHADKIVMTLGAGLTKSSVAVKPKDSKPSLDDPSGRLPEAGNRPAPPSATAKAKNTALRLDDLRDLLPETQNRSAAPPSSAKAKSTPPLSLEDLRDLLQEAEEK